ncbi:endonuclease domain-containing protein [Plantactinospora sp. CA-290183]|uniref:endonuclease domain-containing protein n=1 Tax=Plantactinospora sp. CA-290183 TaxID=3240006 RepID=UPI003D922917
MTTGLHLAKLLSAGQDNLITAAQCRELGLSPARVGRLLAARTWRTVFRGVYRTEAGPPDERQRIRAGLLGGGRAAVAVLSSAARLHGWPVLPDDSTVQISLPAGLRRLDQPDLTTRQLVLAPADVTRVDGMAVTTPARTAADLVLRLSRPLAVPMLDAALRADLLTEQDLGTVQTLIYGNRGATRARESLLATDARAQSPLESRIRLICVDGGVGPEDLQFPVYDDFGTLIALADLAWPSRGVLAEADGRAPHSTPEAVLHDRRRQNALLTRGFVVLRFTWSDVRRSAYVVQTVRQALCRAADRPQPPARSA